MVVSCHVGVDFNGNEGANLQAKREQVSFFQVFSGWMVVAQLNKPARGMGSTLRKMPACKMEAAVIGA